MRLMTAFLMFALLVGSTALAQQPAKAAKMYKWVDENGTVHYSTSPVDEAKAEEVQLRKGPSSTGVAPVATIADSAEVARCEQLRTNLRLLESNNIALEIEENGTRRAMTAEDREPQLVATRSALERCKNVPPPAK